MSTKTEEPHPYCLPFHGKPYPLTRPSSYVIHVEPKIVLEPMLNLGTFARLPMEIRHNIYSHLILATTTVSILAPHSEVTLPTLSATSKDFRRDLKDWYPISRNSNLTNVSDEHVRKERYSRCKPAQYLLDLTTYIPRTHITIKMRRFEWLYDTSLIRTVHVKPDMLEESRSGIDVNEYQFTELVHILNVLDDVHTVFFHLTSQHRDADVSRGLYEKWLEQKGTERCPAQDQRHCRWPVEITWCLIAHAFMAVFDVKVKVSMDGAWLGIWDEACCGYVTDGYVMGRLQWEMRKIGRDLKMKTRGREVCDVM